MGLYRSDNGAENWVDIANGVPSDFGFVMLMHPRDRDCVYTIPVESDQFRCARDGLLRVYRTRNQGASSSTHEAAVQNFAPAQPVAKKPHGLAFKLFIVAAVFFVLATLVFGAGLAYLGYVAKKLPDKEGHLYVLDDPDNPLLLAGASTEGGHEQIIKIYWDFPKRTGLEEELAENARQSL